MKFSSKVEKCGQSPMRKFHPYAVAAKARGIKVYHLNIGQPDVQTPPAFFEAIRKFEQPVLEYAPSPGIPELIDAIKGYYDKLDMHFDKSEIYITTGGSEALAITLQCILDDGDEILIPEPFYPNYNTMVRTCGASITPIPTCPEEGYHYAEREKIEPLINEHTRAIMVTNPGNPTGVVLTDDEMKMLVDLAKKHDLFLICDEAQNLTPNEVKTIITRAGEGTKMVFTGDIFQIDQPYLDQWSNGLSHLNEKMDGQKLFEHIFLKIGERSELSDIASRLL